MTDENIPYREKTSRDKDRAEDELSAAELRYQAAFNRDLQAKDILKSLERDYKKDMPTVDIDSY